MARTSLQHTLQFLHELKRRSVFKVAAAYVVSAWLLVQVASVVLPAFEVGDWAMRGVLIALAVGFPLACLVAWAYEITADGLKLDREDAPPDIADREALNQTADSPWARLASGESLVVLGVLGLLVLVGAGVMLWSTPRLPERPHLAVLPFRVVSTEADADTDVLAAGLVETLTSTVTQFGQLDRSLWVVPASEVRRGLTATAAREQFGASMVVDGSLQIGVSHVRLTLNLIDTNTQRQIHSERLDVSRDDWIGLQDAATNELLQMLNLRTPKVRTASLTRGQTRDPDAATYYLRGRGVLQQTASPDTYRRAIQWFERALLEDPEYALAMAGMGEAYWHLYRTTDDVTWVDAALTHSREALAVDPSLAEVWVTIGIIRRDQRHDSAALAAFEKALTIEPRHAEATRHLAMVHRRRGDWVQAERLYRKAISYQPEYWKGYNALGAFYYARGQYDAALAQYRHGLRLAPSNPSLLNNVAVTYWHMRRVADAMSTFEHILAIDPSRSSVQFNLATAYFYLGRFDDAVGMYAKAVEAYPHDHSVVGALADAQMWSAEHQSDAPDTYHRAITLAKEHVAIRGQDPMVLGSLAQYYARLGMTDSARVWLRRVEPLVEASSVDVSTAFGMGQLYESLGERDTGWRWIQTALDQSYGWIELEHCPWLADLREAPEVKAVMRDG